MNFFLALPLGIAIALAGCATTSQTRSKVLQVQVETGDTLNTIAKQFDTNWRDIAALNKATLQNGLRVGQVLNVVPGPQAEEAVVQDQGHSVTEESLDDDDAAFTPRRKGLFFGSPKDRSAVDFMFPVEGRITSYFGKRGRKLHKGIDISAMVGTPIVAAADGEVVFSGRRRGYGSTVVVDHDGFLSLYAHCSKLIARVGDTVRQGDYIAKAGRTGNARGAHLHFEIRDANNVALDPVQFLRHKSIAQARAKARRDLKADTKKAVAKDITKPKRGLLYSSGS